MGTVRASGILLAACITATFALSASAEDFEATLKGAEEVPPVQTSASGEAEFNVKDDMSISGHVKTKGVKGIAAHIHQVFDARMEEADRSQLLKLEARLSMSDGAGSDETAKVLEEIVQLDPLDGEALMLLGQHYSQSDQPDRAIFYYERAASLESFEGNAKIRQAQVLVGMGRYADAVPLLRRAQELKPRDDVARYLEQVERIAKSKR